MYAEVIETLELKGRVALEHGDQGAVAIFALPDGVRSPTPGQLALIVRPDGWMLRTVIREVKEHGSDGRSVFFRDLTKAEVPAGSHLYWGDAMREHLRTVSQELQTSGTP